MNWEPVKRWRAIQTVHPDRPDPYCIWAEVNGWASYTRPDRAHPASVIIELDDPSHLSAFVACLADKVERFGQDIVVPPEYFGEDSSHQETFVTASVTHRGLRALANRADGRPGRFVKRFDLCDYIEPGRAPVPDERMSRGNCRVPATRPPIDVNKKIIGIIDDGCAFAHRSFLSPGGSTRIAALWDQDATPAFAPANSKAEGQFGTKPYRYLAGREIWRGDASDGSWRGLDTWMGRFRVGAQGVIDEDACYAEAGCDALRARAVHGPHVLDLLAGPLAPAARCYADPDTPPSWQRTLDYSADPTKTDIVFVQLPQAGLQDRSGGWLDSHVLDALRYILGCRSAKQRTVVTLSYGSTIGPHDGTSILSSAIDALKRANNELDVVMAAGNSFASRGHAQVDVKPGSSALLRWRILPGGETPSFVQLWMPKAGEVQIRVAPPGHDLAQMEWVAIDGVAAWPTRQRPAATIVNLGNSSRGEGPMALIAVGPTEQAQEPRARRTRDPAPHGEWQIELRTSSSLEEPVHAYIARNDMGLNTPQRGEQSYFQDDDDVDSYLRSPIDDADVQNEDDQRLFGERNSQTVVVRRRGTLNGIATGETPMVVAGYQGNFSSDRSHARHAPYSSAGQSNLSGESMPRGRRPTTSVPTDESGLLPGIRAAGSRSGVTFRLIGTSAGAPQFARRLLGPTDRGASPLPDPDLSGTS